jgi:hypothetical protein
MVQIHSPRPFFSIASRARPSKNIASVHTDVHTERAARPPEHSFSLATANARRIIQFIEQLGLEPADLYRVNLVAA